MTADLQEEREAECSAIAVAMLCGVDALEKHGVGSYHFSPDHAKVWLALGNASRESDEGPPDPGRVARLLAEKEPADLPAGEQGRLFGMIAPYNGSPPSAGHYARTIIEGFERRKKQRLADHLKKQLSGEAPGDPNETIARLANLAAPAKASAAIQARPLGDLERHPDGDDPDELIGKRFLCRGGGLLLVGATGVGKSSLALQLQIGFALGRETLSLRPRGKLKSLIIQSENDDGDLAEFRDGAFTGMGLSPQDCATAARNVLVVTVADSSGMSFFADIVRPLLAQHRPDIVWIDPAFGFLGGNIIDSQVVGAWLRHGLAPLLKEFNCGSVVAHHTNKPLRGPSTARPGPQDNAYDGAGSAEWSNWHRATLSLDAYGEGFKTFRLIARKRGARLGWRDASDTPTCQKYIQHSNDEGRIFWSEIEEPDAIAAKSEGKPLHTVETLMELVPLSRAITKVNLEEEARKKNIPEKRVRALLQLATENGNLHVWKFKRPGTEGGCPTKAFARFAQP